MSSERFADFMKGFYAGVELMNRAGTNGCFVEFVCLAASVVDGLLRTGLVLSHQLVSDTDEIPTELIYQADDDKVISERMIYKMAHAKSIILQDHFDRLENLYKRRNKVVHRYIISEITTDQVLQIATEYQEIIYIISDRIKELEDKQIQSGKGMTILERHLPDDVRAAGKTLAQEMVNEKHGHPKLAEKLRWPTTTNNS